MYTLYLQYIAERIKVAKDKRWRWGGPFGWELGGPKHECDRDLSHPICLHLKVSFVRIDFFTMLSLWKVLK